jgi:hypothetical protein
MPDERATIRGLTQFGLKIDLPSPGSGQVTKPKHGASSGIALPMVFHRGESAVELVGVDFASS